MAAGLYSWGSDQVIDVVAGGTAILATGPLRKLKITESTIKADGITANIPTGLDVSDPTGAVYRILPPTSAENGAEPESFERGTDNAFHGPHGAILGNGANSPGAGIAPIAATTLCTVKPTNGGTTSVRVQQWY